MFLQLGPETFNGYCNRSPNSYLWHTVISRKRQRSILPLAVCNRLHGFIQLGLSSVFFWFLKKAISSAYIIINFELRIIKSLIYRDNNIGHRTLPCITNAFIWQLTIIPSVFIAITHINRSNKISILIVWNADVKYKNRILTYAFSWFCKWWVTQFIIVSTASSVPLFRLYANYNGSKA